MKFVYMSIEQFAKRTSRSHFYLLRNGLFQKRSDRQYVLPCLTETCPRTGAHITIKRHGALLKMEIRGYAFDNRDEVACYARMRR